MKKNLKTPTKIKAKRRQGFRRRMASKSGRKMISRRRSAGRRKLSA